MPGAGRMCISHVKLAYTPFGMLMMISAVLTFPGSLLMIGSYSRMEATELAEAQLRGERVATRVGIDARRDAGVSSGETYLDVSHGKREQLERDGLGLAGVFVSDGDREVRIQPAEAHELPYRGESRCGYRSGGARHASHSNRAVLEHRVADVPATQVERDLGRLRVYQVLHVSPIFSSRLQLSICKKKKKNLES